MTRFHVNKPGQAGNKAGMAGRWEGHGEGEIPQGRWEEVVGCAVVGRKGIKKRGVVAGKTTTTKIRGNGNGGKVSGREGGV